MSRILLLSLLSVVMTGCAVQKPLYSWGSYEPLLYASYKDPTTIENMRTSLEAQITEADSRNQKVPPGLYAELGTLYLQAGDTNRALGFYGKERNAWPESRGIMDAMIKTLERRQSPVAEEASK